MVPIGKSCIDLLPDGVLHTTYYYQRQLNFTDSLGFFLKVESSIR